MQQNVSVFCISWIGKLNEDVVGIATRVLMVVLISAVLPATEYCFWLTIFLGRGSFSGFHLAFPTRVVLTPQMREPMWGCCHLMSMSIQTMQFGTGKITAGWVQGHATPAHCAVDLTSIILTLTSGPQWYFGSPGINISSELVSV